MPENYTLDEFKTLDPMISDIYRMDANQLAATVGILRGQLSWHRPNRKRELLLMDQSHTYTEHRPATEKEVTELPVVDPFFSNSHWLPIDHRILCKQEPLKLAAWAREELKGWACLSFYTDDTYGFELNDMADEQWRGCGNTEGIAICRTVILALRAKRKETAD